VTSPPITVAAGGVLCDLTSDYGGIHRDIASQVTKKYFANSPPNIEEYCVMSPLISGSSLRFHLRLRKSTV
jgi:hypothetical protein